jgi:hypothetical protein
MYVIDPQNTSDTNTACWGMSAAINLLIRGNFSSTECNSFALNLTEFVGTLFDGDSVVAPLSVYGASPASRFAVAYLRATKYTRTDNVSCNTIACTSNIRVRHSVH